ncbi:conserved hypothetical protein [Ricinus communis]|uniref:Uncharacterized protein n=1 Tax=Ricinus communis TaxID=3988 RepID=B9TK46_RICCO|nr:conserved hypothetical protein [Ricinus communis]
MHFGPRNLRLVAIPVRLARALDTVTTSKLNSTTARENIMNVLKNFEAVFVVTAALACAAVYSVETAPVANAASVSGVPVVVVSAKRLTPEQKLQSLRDERATTMAADSSVKASNI